ncbi:MAG: hypothetical protein ACNS62_05620 [Candidatus Cyclobacteriaceae bacterium M3_2C_046]
MAAVSINLLLVSSCKDEEEEQISKIEVITSTPWEMTALNGTISSLTTINFGKDRMPDCNQDDLFDFSDNNTYQILDNDIVCSSSVDGVIATGSWQFKDNENIIELESEYFQEFFISAGFPVPSFLLDGKLDFTIEEFTANTITISLDEDGNIPIQGANLPANFKIEITLVPEN